MGSMERAPERQSAPDGFEWRLLSGKVEQLSPLPELWEKLAEIVLKSSLDLPHLQRLVSLDMALTCRILSVANSDEFGKPYKVGDIGSAFQHLGLDMVKNLILAMPAAHPAHSGLYGQQLKFEVFWRHSVACAILAGRIASEVFPRQASEARICGLLHDIGKILLNIKEPEHCARIQLRGKNKSLSFQEEEILQLSHAEAAGQVLVQMNLPRLFSAACGRHHYNWERLDLGEPADLMAACVGLADYLTYRLNLGDGGNHSRSVEVPPEIHRIGLSETRLEAIEKDAVEEYETLILQIRPGSASIERLYEQIRHANHYLGRRSLFLNKNVAELSHLQEIHEDLNRSQGIESMLQQVSLRLGSIFPAEMISFLLMLEPDATIHNFSKLTPSELFLEQSTKHMTEDFFDEGVEFPRQPGSKVELLIPDATEGRVKLERVRTVLRLPLQGREGLIGRLGLFGSMAGAFTQADEDLATIIAGEIALALDRANWMRRTEILSMTDGLTGLYNHRRFLELLDHEFGRSRRYETPLCLIMLDIDHFKQINDTYGHPQGDRMLVGVAKILKKMIRETDMAARYGGEEFSIILPSTELEGALALAERIRTSVEEETFPCPESHPLNITVSLGVAMFGGSEVEHPNELVKLSDKALYLAKESGRNQSRTDRDLIAK